MGEKLKIFVDLFNKSVDYLIEDIKVDLDEFTAARKAAISITSPGTGEYKTLGDLIAKIIPENGEINNDLYRTIFAQMSLDGSDKAEFNILFKRKSAPGRYANALKLKEKGEAFFNAAMYGIGSAMLATTPKLSFKEIIGDGSEKALIDFNEFIHSTDEIDDALYSYSMISDRALRGKSQGREFYDAVIENGDPIGKKEESNVAPAAINAAPVETPVTPSGSPVNPVSGEKKAVAEKSTVNPATTPAVETSVEKTAGTVTGAPAVLPKEAEAPKPSTAINISIETPKPDVAPKKEEAPAQVVPSEKTEVVNTPVMLAQPTSTPTAQPATTTQSAEPAKSSPVNAEEIKKKEAENNKVLTGFLGLGSTSESKTNITSSTQTINSPSNTQSSKSTETSAVNQTTSNTALNNSTTSSSTQNTANSSGIMSDINQLMLNKSSALTNKYFGSIFSSDEKKKPSEPENTSVTEPTVQSNSEKVEANPTEVSKTTPSFPEKIQPSSEKIIEKANNKVLEKTQEMMNQKETIKSETSMGSEESYSTITPAGPEAMSSDQPDERPSSGTSMAGVEARLARLEYLLSNPLEVKIIE